MSCVLLSYYSTMKQHLMDMLPPLQASHQRHLSFISNLLDVVGSVAPPLGQSLQYTRTQSLHRVGG